MRLLTPVTPNSDTAEQLRGNYAGADHKRASILELGTSCVILFTQGMFELCEA